MLENPSFWVCCQLGAREHYAIPRALHQAGQLAHLVTDAWISPHSTLNLLPKSVLVNLRERFHPDLTEASVHGLTGSLLRFELAQRLRGTRGWRRIIARNVWFQEHGVQVLDAIASKLSILSHRPTVFAYSYAALELFRYAKRKGWRTILGQIDPGPLEEQLVLQEHIRYSTYQANWQPAPETYWSNWHLECSLADRIIVNSAWSRQALQQVGIPLSKIDIIPLVYQASEQAHNFVRSYPLAFSSQRPLRVLFLGQVILRKGIAALLEAAKLLRDQPIEFWLVGSQGVNRPDTFSDRLHWIGPVSRSATARYYQMADVFLFPTLSDGFGLTQLEAQAWKLPIIASQFCGEVVEHQKNGIILAEVTGEAIARALEYCLKNPQLLQIFSQHAIQPSEFNLLQLQHHLQALPYATV